jgi:murein DD-endopeptidase MepM/ murein hydrolase activator NlpD
LLSLKIKLVPDVLTTKISPIMLLFRNGLLLIIKVKIISVFIKTILTKITLKIADGLFYLHKKLLQTVKTMGFGLLLIGRYTIFPFILFSYRNGLRFKIKFKNFNWQKINYLIFIKKYLPGLGVILILLIVTTNNILAQGYSADEYANRTLLSTLVNSDEEQWNALIEESGAALKQPKSSNYLEDQGLIQEVTIDNPLPGQAETGEISGVSPDASSLVAINPENNEIVNNEPGQTRFEPITYIVQSGDVLSKISEKFDITINTILWENKLDWSSTIRPGQKLIILPTSGINYEVKSGDTVSSIAKKYQGDVNKIIEANKLADASDIGIGDLLFVPNGVKPTAVVSSYKPKVSPIYSEEEVPSVAAVDTGTKLLWATNSTRVTQYYSWRHHGLDIGNKKGNPIYAAEDGKIERSGWTSGYGYNVIINHGNGIKTLYGHASKLLVEVGETVSRGQTIALIGSTGWSTGPHLHLEVIVNGVRNNPLNYIK